MSRWLSLSEWNTVFATFKWFLEAHEQPTESPEQDRRYDFPHDPNKRSSSRVCAVSSYLSIHCWIFFCGRSFSARAHTRIFLLIITLRKLIILANSIGMRFETSESKSRLSLLRSKTWLDSEGFCDSSLLSGPKTHSAALLNRPMNVTLSYWFDDQTRCRSTYTCSTTFHPWPAGLDHVRIRRISRPKRTFWPTKKKKRCQMLGGTAVVVVLQSNTPNRPLKGCLAWVLLASSKRL